MAVLHGSGQSVQDVLIVAELLQHLVFDFLHVSRHGLEVRYLHFPHVSRAALAERSREAPWPSSTAIQGLEHLSEV